MINFDNLTNERLLDDMVLSLSCYLLNHLAYPNKEYLYKRWLMGEGE